MTPIHPHIGGGARKAALALALGLCGALTAPAAHAADLNYTFDTDAQGFGVSGATMTHAGGSLSLRDIDDSDMVVVFPTAGLGDWSRFSGGTFSFDAINLNGAATDWGTFGTLRIESGSLAVERDLVAPGAPGSNWTTYSATLDAATWAPVLGNVTRVTLMLESHIGWDSNSGYELNGLDNVKVSAVPEPSVTMLTVLGGVFAGLLAWRRRAA